MNRIFQLLIICCLRLTMLSAAETAVEHHLKVILTPGEKTLSVSDTVHFPGSWAGRKIHFLIHKDLHPQLSTKVSTEVSTEVSTADFKLKRETGKINHRDFGLPENKFKLPENIEFEHYSLTLPRSEQATIICLFEYSGQIDHPVDQLSEEYARGFSETPGTISAEGVYLAGSTYWLPWFNADLITFNLLVLLPAEWDAVSQGARTVHEIRNSQRIVRWDSPELMEEVYLIAAPFYEYQSEQTGVAAMAFLRTADETLARKYLETTAQYLEMYNALIGPYPYSKFALVENFWETGYGMPSFTLLGQKVIRFPFILHSSYPHELLHNWWGNGVYVDYESGNWCEGLTVFFADHLIKEQRGQGVEYRRSALQAFTDYVHSKNDFPLIKFTSRHDASSAAIGYNKSMMIFNMLRQDIGDELFINSIQDFYVKNKFKKAGFNDLKKSFESISSRDFNSFFRQWLTRSGAPLLEISRAECKPDPAGFILNFTLKQTQADDVFELEVPVAIHLQESKKAVMQRVRMDRKIQDYQLTFNERPLLVDVDPQFDLFRFLHRDEVPPALSQAFGSEKVAIVLPVTDKPDLKEAYRTLAGNWAKDTSGQIIVSADTSLAAIPADRSVWIFGRENIWHNQFLKELVKYDADLKMDSLRIGKIKTSFQDHSIVLTVRNPNNADKVLVWVSAPGSAAIPGLGRKLPHYGKYSYLGFEGDEPTNVLQGQWPAGSTPMRARVLQTDGANPDPVEKNLPERKALAELKPLFSAARLKSDIDYLAGENLQGRGLGSAGIEQAAAYLAAQFKNAGLIPIGANDTFFQTWTENTGAGNKPVILKNIIGMIPGSKKEWAEQSVVICAHYDHLGLGWPDVRAGNEGKIHFGADDNASGVAVLLELARSLGSSFSPGRTVIFLATTAEESGLKGSKYYIQNMKKFPVQNIIGVLNLDTVGRLNNNKLLVLNHTTATEWKHIVMGVGFVTGIGYELVNQDLEASDQASFISAGIPAIQLFSGAHQDYHKPEDTADKIDIAGMVKVASFSKEIIEYLSNREDGLTVTIKTTAATAVPATPTGRRVATGIMPDFAFTGQGVRVAQVAASSPADLAGVKAGDILIKVETRPVKDLKEYSEVLKQHEPGDTLAIIFLREGQEIKTAVKLEVR
jgi:aminopeptidase N